MNDGLIAVNEDVLVLTSASCSCYVRRRPSSDCDWSVDVAPVDVRGSHRVYCQSTGLWSTPRLPSQGKCRSLRPHWFCHCSDFLTVQPVQGWLSAEADAAVAACIVVAAGWKTAADDNNSNFHSLWFCASRDPWHFLTCGQVVSHDCCKWEMWLAVLTCHLSRTHPLSQSHISFPAGDWRCHFPQLQSFQCLPGSASHGEWSACKSL